MFRQLRLISLPFITLGLIMAVVSVVLVSLNRTSGDSFDFGLLIPGFIGFVILIVGFGMFAYAHGQIVKRRRLESDGRKIIAQVADLYHDTSQRINGRHPWAILAEVTDERGIVTEYRETIGIERPQVAVGLPVVVGIDPDNPSSYAIFPEIPVETVKNGPAAFGAGSGQAPGGHAWSDPSRNYSASERTDRQTSQRSGSAWGEKTDRNRGPFRSN